MFRLAHASYFLMLGKAFVVFRPTTISFSVLTERGSLVSMFLRAIVFERRFKVSGDFLYHVSAKSRPSRFKFDNCSEILCENF